MNKRRKRIRYEVAIDGHKPIGVMARSVGHAARQVFRVLIAGKVLKRQPESNSDGGWEGVSITCES